MNLKESLLSKIRSFKLKHFEHFEGHQLINYKDIHKGRRCFIIGNGPSLCADDLTKIKENGDITFAFNRIFHIFSDTEWRPTYYLSQDVQILKSSVDELKQLDCQTKFIPIQSKWYDGVNIEDANYFNLSTKDSELYPSFSTDISKSVSISKTVVYTAIQFAVYMGIKEIYLIGVDHHFRVSQNSNGDIIVDNTVKDYFSDKYNDDLLKMNWIPNTDESTYTYISGLNYSKTYGFRIYNATRGGKLEVFERRNFDDLFSQSTNGNK